MAFVLDCSVTLPWFLEDERTSFTDGLLFAAKRTEYWVPPLWCLEFANALLSAQRKRRIERARRLEALDQVLRLLIQVDAEPPDLTVVSNLAEKHGLTVYDAAYLELAIRRGFGVVTLDRELAQACAAEGVMVQAPGGAGAAQKRQRYNV